MHSFHHALDDEQRVWATHCVGVSHRGSIILGGFFWEQHRWTAILSVAFII